MSSRKSYFDTLNRTFTKLEDDWFALTDTERKRATLYALAKCTAAGIASGRLLSYSHGYAALPLDLDTLDKFVSSSRAVRSHDTVVFCGSLIHAFVIVAVDAAGRRSQLAAEYLWNLMVDLCDYDKGEKITLDENFDHVITTLIGDTQFDLLCELDSFTQTRTKDAMSVRARNWSRRRRILDDCSFVSEICANIVSNGGEFVPPRRADDPLAKSNKRAKKAK